METLSASATPELSIAYRLLFERNPVPMWVYEVQTLRLLAVNDAALARHGYSEQGFVALTLLDIHHEDDAQRLQEYLKQPLGHPITQKLWRHRDRKGDFVELEIATEEFEFEGVRARMVLGRDMTEQRHAEQAQRDLAQQLTITFESISEAFFMLDRDWRFTYVNGHAEKMLCRPRKELLGGNLWEMFPEAVGSTFQIEYERAVVEGKRVSFETCYAPFGGWLAVEAFPSPQGLAVYCRDVTEKHVGERDLFAERQTLSMVINTTADAIIGVDQEGRIKVFNPGAEEIFRQTRQNMLGQGIETLLPARYHTVHKQHRRDFVESGVTSRMMGLSMVKGLRSDGQELDLEGTLSQATVDQQKMIVVCLRDVTQRVRADAEFERSRAQLADLTQKLMLQEKMLVRRLAQALHDQLGQTIAAIRMAHETIVALQADKSLPETNGLQTQMGTLIEQAVRQVRQVLMDLRPPLLEEQGLAAALDNELRSRSLTRPQIDMLIDVQPEVASMRWPNDVEYAAFMVAREALENALRHSSASFVSVRLSGAPMSLQLKVADDGVGIIPGATPQSGHLGLLGMRERAQAVGATFAVDSSAGHGTRVVFNWQSEP